MISIENMQESLSNVKADVEKFNNGNKSAGTRIRKVMQELKAQAQELRVNVQEIKNNK